MFCISSSCVPCFASFSELFIFGCPFGILERLFTLIISHYYPTFVYFGTLLSSSGLNTLCSSNEHGSSQMTYLEYFYYYFHRYRRPILGTVLRPSPILPMHVYDYYSPMAVLVQQRLCLPPEHFPEK